MEEGRWTRDERKRSEVRDQVSGDVGDLIEILRKMFEANHGKSTVKLKDKCSDCGCDVIIDITPTSAGFGLQGGSLFKCSPDVYSVQCADCYKNNPKIEDGRRTRDEGRGRTEDG